MARGGAFRTGGGVTVLGRRCGVLIHRTLHCWIGGRCSRLAIDAMAYVVDSVGVLECVGQPMCHTHLLSHLVHLGAVEMGSTLLLGLALGLCDLDLSRLGLL